MSSIQFKDLKITTMTLIFKLEGMIDIRSAFHLLPITKIAFKKHRESKKCDLPVSPIPGAILSMRYKENKKELVRGIIRNDKKSFKNSITLDISTKIKNISLKISRNTIQLCGAPSKAVGTEATMYIIEHLTNIKDCIDYINKNVSKYNDCVEWLKLNAKGAVSKKIISEKIVCKNYIINIQDEIVDHAIKLSTPPSYLDGKIMKFLTTYAEDLFYYSDFINKISNIRKFNTIYRDNLSIQQINEVMVNYNYNLGYKVNRLVLNELIDGRNGLYSHYDPNLVHCVTVELPYEPLEVSEKKKKSKSSITFLLYHSGSITMSGANYHIMERAFNVFMDTIEEIKEEIML